MPGKAIRQLDLTICSSPVGEIAVFGGHGTLCLLDFNENRDRSNKLLKKRFGEFETREVENLSGIREMLERYFKGDWRAFEDIELDAGGTDFQQSVWNRLKAISTGDTMSYDQLAREVGRPESIRAVAGANASNPVSIIIPCHRVIGKNGAMRGYAGGVERKIWLLKHEKAIR